MRDPREFRGGNRVETAAMSAAWFSAVMPLFMWLRHITTGLDHFTAQYPDVVAWLLACAAAVPVMLMMRGLIRRLPAEEETVRGRRRLTRELAAALAVGYATLTATGGLVAAVAIDRFLAGHPLGPVYAYLLAATVSVGAAILAGRRSFRRFTQVVF